MAKDNREIVRGIRVLVESNGKTAKSKTLVSGMEDELAATFTQAQLSAMVKRGDLTGNWKSTKK
jgi:hypothetical protein